MRRLVLILAVLSLAAPLAAQDGSYIRYYPPAISPSGGTFTGQVLFNPGTAPAAPSISWVGDSDTGIDRNASNSITVSTGAAERYVFSNTAFTPNGSDLYLLGAALGLWQGVYVARSIQGSKSKTLTDNTATAFVRLAVADDDYEHCNVIYTAFAEDTATDARQIRAGNVHAAILNNSGTETVAYSTGDSSVVVTAGTFTCTFDGNSGAADTIDLRATCDTSLAATTTLTFEWRLDCPSTVTVTPQ